MTHSESIAEIVKALVLAQGKMGDVRKTSMNPAFRSKYADLAAVVEAVVPALQSAGIAVIQSASCDYREDGAAVVTVETMFAHSSGEWIKAALDLRPVKYDPQGVGSAITYGRRYQLLAMAGVAPEDDDGNSASGNVSAPANAAASPSKPKNNGKLTPPAAAPAAAPPSRGSEREWEPAIKALAAKLPPAEVEKTLGDFNLNSIGDINTREIARSVYACLHSLADTLGVAS